MDERKPVKTRIKISGVSRLCDLIWANEVKPDYVGFIFSKSINRVTLEQAEILRRRLDPDIHTVGVFTNSSFWLIAELLESGIIDAAHLYADLSIDEILQLRRMTDKPLIKTVLLRGPEDIEIAQRYPVDFLLYECPRGQEGNMEYIQMLQEYGPQERKFFISDRICLGRVGEMIQRIHPYGINVYSLTERFGGRDGANIREIIKKIRES